MKRRKFLAKGAAGAGGVAAATTIGAPAIAQERREMVIVASWGRDFPGLGISAQRLAQRITDMTDGRITTQYFASGERVGGFDVFDAVASGNAQAYISAEYWWIRAAIGVGYASLNFEPDMSLVLISIGSFIVSHLIQLLALISELSYSNL